MRTRILNKMSAGEVDEYLARGGDTIFIAVGVVECHGTLPIDCETVGPEAFAVALAEKNDALALINLPYFYAGGTYTSNATLHMTIANGMAYLTKICKSLMDQGFKKMILLSGHGPAGLTINAFARDFFEKYHIHPCHISTGSFSRKAYGSDEEKQAEVRKYLFYGQYAYMGMKDYLPIRPDLGTDYIPRKPIEPEMQAMQDAMREYGGGILSQVYSDPREHGGGLVLRTEEERDAACEKGLRYFREIVDTVDLTNYLKCLADYQAYVARMVEKYPRIGKI